MQAIPEDVIRRHPCKLLHKANSATQADLYELEWEGARAVLKDYGGLLRPRRRPFGRLVGRFSVRREAEALDRLTGLSAHPRLIGRVGKSAFLCERVEGDVLPDHNENRVDPEVFNRLTRLVEDMHGRGVAHGDLRRKNIFLASDGSLGILDYETAVLDNGRRYTFRGRAFRMACRIDRIKVLKMRQRWLPETPLTPEDKAMLEGEPYLLRFARFMRQNLYRRFIKRMRE